MGDQALSIARPRAVETTEALAAIASVFAAAVLRIAVLFRYRIDSDETQHLHVAWAWTHGLVQYRDVFDNHMPLFHILSVPLLLAVGERPEALIAGRLAMLPLFALIVWLTYRLAANVYHQRHAAWAAAIGSLVPLFFLCSVEFRPDVLWAVCWLATLSILGGKAITVPRAASAGFFLGLAAAISAKTVLLAVSLAVAAVTTFVLTCGTGSQPVRGRAAAAFGGGRVENPSHTGHWTVRAIWSRVMTFAVAALLPPAAIAAWFASIGAWDGFVRCTLTHNLVTHEHPHRILFILPSAAIIALVTRRIVRQDAPLEVRRRRVFLFLAASVNGALLLSFWPILEREHWLPFVPAFAAAVVPLAAAWSGSRWPRIATAVIALELIRIVALSAPWSDQTGRSTAPIQLAMELTSPAEKVVDLKGELLFRQRATYAIFEKITKKAISSGRMADTIAADVLRSHAMVAIADDASFPRQGRAFLQRNFVDVGGLRVAGVMVQRGRFRIELPAAYALVSASGPFQGTLDGVPYSGPRFLGVGAHTAVSDSPAAAIWSRATVLGLTPFHRQLPH
jgi:hypothetical protein